MEKEEKISGGSDVNVVVQNNIHLPKKITGEAEGLPESSPQRIIYIDLGWIALLLVGVFATYNFVFRGKGLGESINDVVAAAHQPRPEEKEYVDLLSKIEHQNNLLGAALDSLSDAQTKEHTRLNKKMLEKEISAISDQMELLIRRALDVRKGVILINNEENEYRDKRLAMYVCTAMEEEHQNMGRELCTLKLLPKFVYRE